MVYKGERHINNLERILNKSIEKSTEMRYRAVKLTIQMASLNALPYENTASVWFFFPITEHFLKIPDT